MKAVDKSTRDPKKLCPACVGSVEEMHLQLLRLLHKSIGQAHRGILKPCLSQSHKWSTDISQRVNKKLKTANRK